MPTYEYKCEKCELITEKRFAMKEMKNKVACEKCGRTANKIISAPPTVVMDSIKPFYHHSSGLWISSKADKNRAMKQHQESDARDYSRWNDMERTVKEDKKIKEKKKFHITM